jgi:ribonuclease G
LPEWLIERGIGETRAALIDGGEILEARILIEGVPAAGTILDARLKRTGLPAIAIANDEYLLPRGAPGVTEGSSVKIEITRERIGGAEPSKRPLARVATGEPSMFKPPEGRELAFPSPTDLLARASWPDLIDEARNRHVRFPGGELHISLTPAMTLIDVDGTLPIDELAVAGASAAALAIRRHGIGGSIGIDFPTVGKAARQAAADAIDALLPQPFERTAVNGFGFLQIVRPRRHASLFELAADRPAFEARALLRRVAMDSAGPKRLVAHAAVIAMLEARPEWLETLSRQAGGKIALRDDPALPMSGGYAEPF